MADLKLYLREPISAGALDLIYLSRPDGSADGKVALQALQGALAGILSPNFAAGAHTHVAADVSGLAAVATSGAYADLTGKPSLAPVATSGAYSDLTGKPTLGTAAALDADTDSTLAANSNSKLATQAAVKTYVDNLVQGLSWKKPVRAATTANITLSGAQTIDGVSVIAGDRVLVKNQSTGSQNGIYVAAAGAWSRATDADSSAELVSAAVLVSEGTTLQDTQWTCTTDLPITVGSTSLAFAMVSGGSGGMNQLTGDVTAGPGSGSQAATIPNNTVTYAKMQDISATARLLGRKTAGAGDPEELTLSEALDFVTSAAQGDLLYRNASGWARLPAGTAGQVLQTQGAGANPQWVLPGRTLIQRITTSGGQTTIDFTSIPSTYKNLRLVGQLRSAGSDTIVLIRFNNDTNNANYSGQQLQNQNGTLSGANFGTSNTISAILFDQPQSTATAGVPATVEANIPNYSSTTLKKSYLGHSGYLSVYKAINGNWLSTAAINRITLSSSGGAAFENGLEISLYGEA